MELTVGITNSQDLGGETEEYVLDFSRAFDKVNHHKLLYKLPSARVSHQLVARLEGFLTGQTQKVIVYGEQSTESALTSGVPQGSFIGPTMFLFYINDMPDNIGFAVRLFAGDTILCNNTDGYQTLQDDQYTLENWKKLWNIEFHPLNASISHSLVSIIPTTSTSEEYQGQKASNT